MKATPKAIQLSGSTLQKVSAAIIGCLMILSLPSCQENTPLPEDELMPSYSGQTSLKGETFIKELRVFYGPETFTRGKGQPVTEMRSLTDPDVMCYEDLVLKIKNGSDKKTRVSSAELFVDGVMVAGPSDFSKNEISITKPLTGLTLESKLEVKLNSTPGSFLEVWIEGWITLTIPSFAQIGPVSQDSEAPALPSVSDNGIKGTWVPEKINTSVAGEFTFAFTPEPGQCATGTTMTIEVVNKSTVADAEGNVYNTVKLGTQWWMAQNLKSTKYRNGELIGTTDTVTKNISGESTPKYQWIYKDAETKVALFGRLYTWYAVTDSRGVCPAGWHLPTPAEWTTLATFLTDNGYGYEGSGPDIGKSLAATAEWTADPTPGNVGNDPASNNSSDFAAYPGGSRSAAGSFTKAGTAAFWWTSATGSFRALNNNSAGLASDTTSNKNALSVRCIKD